MEEWWRALESDWVNLLYRPCWLQSMKRIENGTRLYIVSCLLLCLESARANLTWWGIWHDRETEFSRVLLLTQPIITVSIRKNTIKIQVTGLLALATTCARHDSNKLQGNSWLTNLTLNREKYWVRSLVYGNFQVESIYENPQPPGKGYRIGVRAKTLINLTNLWFASDNFVCRATRKKLHRETEPNSAIKWYANHISLDLFEWAAVENGPSKSACKRKIRTSQSEN